MSVKSMRSTEWSKEPLPIGDFIKKFKLPQIVKIHDSENKRFQAPGSFNLQQPILLYKVYRCRKIHGRALALDNKGRINPTDPTLIIPESYPGWLAMVSKDGRTAGYFNSVGEVSRALVRLFLVQDAVVGLKATNTGMCRTVITGGHVLKSMGPYEDLNRQNVLLASKGNIHDDLMMYLKCLTQHGETVYLPYSAKGRFYCIATPKSHSINHLFLLSNLLKVSRLPCFVRIVSGPKPHVSLPFTNIIKLEDVHHETIILGCALVNNEPILLEINANSEFDFLKATDERLLQKSETFKRMCQVCTVEGDRWRQQIRVAHHVVSKQKKEEDLPKKEKLTSSSTLSRSQITRSSLDKSPVDTSKPNKCKDIKPALPTLELIDFLKYTYRGYMFPKKFWMFRKSRKFEFPDNSDKISKLPFDILKAYYSKSKGRKCLTLKITAPKDSVMLIDAEKARLEVQRRTNSDAGYGTSYADDESIYHSIC